MTMFSVRSARPSNGHGHAVPIIAGAVLATLAAALVAYLLWPTWRASAFKGPERLPVSIGGTVFNVPAAAIRVKIQRHTGPQERVDLGFDYPSLTPPEAPHHVSADQIDQAPHPIDRIFVSIAAHHDALSPEARLKTIYPRYLNPNVVSVQDGLSMRNFRSGTPYDVEDLFLAEQPMLVARCTRDAATPGMCLSERRVEGADLIFRFPRSWLSQWQDVAAAMERLTTQMHPTR
ncbi:MAG: hypothetical protein E6614_22185 [Bradyrhizobium sp.]|jgi:hypothetical protein|uniref:Uncharacterized protein n=1 Tax=Bradyrhizobium denitrificans TaxID=2734912 RepID=A0ABS5GDP7_9BRAD|nr:MULTISPECIES: hypothetical protein [Bradyrhizobium]RTM02752.1 MAG: hypothetical protein EKK32_10050 [Bradyrhizobiaceae bacterium]ABQ37219.1 putative exported protein of unknown function [Bradyrhizobium sp. BTAi1]MBR1139467.1 hypothetical protein [Bradyrhizobium denitrificans]MCL8487647.1 hypothetical protein [Bradyrhizobium denitrificans]MDU0960964.1 hypothetical protein [Bradyrhizobium sp.]